MQKSNFLISAAVLAAALALPAQSFASDAPASKGRAAALPTVYSKIVVFGDGLSDGGFFGRFTGNGYWLMPKLTKHLAFWIYPAQRAA